MTYEVVYNGCFGGFGLSKKAIKWLEKHGCTNTDFEYPRNRRHNPLLVECVKTLGSEANDDFADLKIYKLKERFYKVGEYDGSEWVEEPGDLQWVDASDGTTTTLVYCDNCTTIKQIIE